MSKLTLDKISLTANEIFEIAENNEDILINEIDKIIVLDHQLDKASTAVAVAGGRRLLALRSIRKLKGRVEWATYARSEFRNLSDRKRQRWMQLAFYLEDDFSPTLLHIAQRVLLPIVRLCKGETVEYFLKRHGINTNFDKNNDELGIQLALEARTLVENFESKQTVPERQPETERKSPSSPKRISKKSMTWEDIPVPEKIPEDLSMELEAFNNVLNLIEWLRIHKSIRQISQSSLLISALWELDIEISKRIQVYNDSEADPRAKFKMDLSESLYAKMK